MLPHETPYLYRPHLDPSLAQFRVMHDGGWVTKVPNREGFVFIHLKEADWETYRRAFRTLNIHLAAMADTPDQPADSTKGGLLVKVVLDNRSKEAFVRDWSYRDMTYDLFLNMCFDLENLWFPRFDPDVLNVRGIDPKMKELLTSRIDVGPGKVVEKLFLFKPDKRPDRSIMAHGFHMAMVFFTTKHRFDDDGEAIEVPFPFFNPHREVPNAMVDLTFSADHDPTEVGDFVLPGLQVIRSREGAWMTEGYVRFGSPTSKGQFSAYVPAIRTTPGPVAGVPPGELTRQKVSEPGYRLPSNLRVNNPARPVGGDMPRKIEGWVKYSFKEEKEAKAKWEAMPLKAKMEEAARLIALDYIDDRVHGIRIVGKYANEAYLDMVLPLFKDKHGTITKSARRAYQDIVGMSYEHHMAKLASEESERQRIIDIARKEGRVTHILIKDSVLQRTQIDLGDSGETHVKIQDSVVTRSGIEGTVDVKGSVVVQTKVDDGEKVDTDVKIGQRPKDGETEEDYEQRLARYEKALKKALADGVITANEKRLLDMLRKKFGISEDEHEMVLEMLK